MENFLPIDLKINLYYIDKISVNINNKNRPIN
jgi:hypothetical protein